MARFFRQASDDQFTGSLAYLDSQRSLFRNNQASGLVEIQAAASDLVVLLFAGGDVAGAYRMGPDSSAPIPPTKIGVGWAKKEAPIRTVNLPDQASRAVWLALESGTKTRQQVQDLTEWNKLLETCLADRVTGLIEVASDMCDGFLLLHEGVPIKTEAIFSTAQGFHDSLLAAQEYLDNPWQITVYATNPAAQAYQCTLLRLSITNWGSRMLARYQDLVGQKLLQFLNATLSAQTVSRRWDIRPVNTEIIDHHFFRNCETGAQVYRDLFQDMVLLITNVIGDMLTQRALGDTFNQLGEEERALLEAQRLIPAAFLA